MSLSILPPITLSATEVAVVNTALANPAVKKYFTMLAQVNATDILCGAPADGESAESYLRRQANVKGGLEVLETLLTIQAIVGADLHSVS